MCMYKKCFVAYLDILGFKNIVEDENTEASTIIDTLQQLKKLARIHPKGNPKIHEILMSDTLLWFSETDDEQSFEHIASLVAGTICFGIGLSVTNIPDLNFRGAISWGDFYYDNEENLFFGRAFNDASDWEKKQEWIGAVLTPACADFIQEQRFSFDTSLIVKYEAPIKEKVISGNKCETIIKSQNCLCLNWTSQFGCKDVVPNGQFLKSNNDEFKHKLEHTYKFYTTLNPKSTI